MSSDSFIQDLKRNIIERLQLTDVTPESIDDEGSLFEGLGLDSIDAVELVVMLEKEYGIRLTDIETARAAFATVKTLAAFVVESQGAEENS